MKVSTWGGLFKSTRRTLKASQWKSMNPFGKSCRTVPGKAKDCPDLCDLRAQNLLQPSWCSQNSLWLWNYQQWGLTGLTWVGQFMLFAWMDGFLSSQWCWTKRESLTCFWTLKRSLIMLQGETFMTFWHSVKSKQLLQLSTASRYGTEKKGIAWNLLTFVDIELIELCNPWVIMAMPLMS